MLLVKMKLEIGKPSQYPWHVGERFPVPESDDKNVLEVYADGDELHYIESSTGIRSKDTVCVFNADGWITAIGICRMIRIRQGDSQSRDHNL